MVKIRGIIPPNDLISGYIVKYDNLPTHTHLYIYMTTDLYCYHHLFSYYIYICDIAIYDDNVVSFFEIFITHDMYQLASSTRKDMARRSE